MSHLLFASALFMTACSVDVGEFAEKMTTPDERRFAAEYLALVRPDELDTAFAQLSSELRVARSRAQLEIVADLLQSHPPDSMTLIGANVGISPAGRSVNLTWEYPSRGKWILANVAALHADGAPPQVIGVHALQGDESLFAANALRLRDRSVVHYLWLLATIAVPLFSLAVAIKVATAREMPKRWRWVIASLVGVMKLSFNWSTGATTLQLLSVTLLSAGFLKAAPAAPWMIFISFPIGAIVALGKYRSWRGSSDHGKAAD